MVVGIIVALAATIVPAVARFANSGEDAARQQEMQNIPTAIDPTGGNTAATRGRGI